MGLKLQLKDSMPDKELLEVYNFTNEDDKESNIDDLESLKSVIEQGVNSANSSRDPFNISNYMLNPGDISVDYQDLADRLDKQLSHTRDLLADTEENNFKLMEQVRILKEEIRRLERNMERQVKKFLAPEQVSDERYQLLPILRTMLRLSNEECTQIQNSIQKTKVVETSPGLTPKTSVDNKDWTGYFGSFTGIF